MLECYIICSKNSQRALERYANLFPGRDLPNRRYFLQLYRKFRSNQHTFAKTRTPKKFIVDEQTEINVLAYFEVHRENSVRDLSSESGLSLSVIHNILKKYKYVPYKHHLTQTLYPGDSGRRLQFCQWFVNKAEHDPSFMGLILWSDEASFSNAGMFNKKNNHYWSRENLMLTKAHRPQRRFSVNVWCGLMGSRLLGPIFYQGNLTAERYLELIRPVLEDLLDDMDLASRESMYMQQDGAPAHNSRIATEMLENMFPSKWIGTNGPIQWPPRSPDLTPLDFFIWGYVKNTVYKNQYETVETLQNAISTALHMIAGRTILKATRSVHRRCVKCIEVQGEIFEHLL